MKNVNNNKTKMHVNKENLCRKVKWVKGWLLKNKEKKNNNNNKHIDPSFRNGKNIQETG